METCQLLLEHGADVNAKDSGGDTPLQATYNMMYPDTETHELLRQYGAK